MSKKKEKHLFFIFHEFHQSEKRLEQGTHLPSHRSLRRRLPPGGFLQEQLAAPAGGHLDAVLTWLGPAERSHCVPMPYGYLVASWPPGPGFRDQSLCFGISTWHSQH